MREPWYYGGAVFPIKDETFEFFLREKWLQKLNKIQGSVRVSYYHNCAKNKFYF
jgi:hypothetical protein